MLMDLSNSRGPSSVRFSLFHELLQQTTWNSKVKEK